MSGVLVSAKLNGSTFTTTVVTDATGRYAFPRARLQAGTYAIGIRAIGYDLEAPVSATVRASGAATADLRLQKTRDLASQLSNAEWLSSMPGTDAQKAEIRGCAHCHMLNLITRSHHDVAGIRAGPRADGRVSAALVSTDGPDAPAPRIGGGDVSRERAAAGEVDTASRVSGHAQSERESRLEYSLKTLPRPSADATRVIYTEYDLPKRTRQPHDVIVDSTGMVWYASFGEQILGKLDPRTGKVTEYQIPILKPDAPTGILGMRFDQRRESVARDAVSGRHREVRPEDGEVSDVESAAGAERQARPGQPGQPGARVHRRQGLAAGCRHIHRDASRHRDRASSRSSSRTRFRARTSTTSFPIRRTTATSSSWVPKKSVGSTRRPVRSRSSRRRPEGRDRAAA